MRTSANMSCQRSVRFRRAASELASFVVAFLFFLLPLPAQQSQQTQSQQTQSAAGDAPGWPITSPMPSHGRVIPDPTNGMDRPEGASEGSCSLWEMAATQRATVSTSALQVPEKAKGEFGRACGDVRRDKLAGAEQHLRKAVQVYPRYASAWVLLGQVLEAEKRVSDAQNACSQATIVDANYTSAFLCLADIEAQQGLWSQALAMSERALALDPAASVYSHFYSAVAEFHLSDLTAAERNALDSIGDDRDHRIPQTHLLLAQIYGAKNDLNAAANELRAYLKIAPKGPDAENARKSLARLESRMNK
jgi:tetratricopeptide (TPR) repeat protein